MAPLVNDQLRKMEEQAANQGKAMARSGRM